MAVEYLWNIALFLSPSLPFGNSRLEFLFKEDKVFFNKVLYYDIFTSSNGKKQLTQTSYYTIQNYL